MIFLALLPILLLIWLLFCHERRKVFHQIYRLTHNGIVFAEHPRLPEYTIANPYSGPGIFHKAQLHMHTSHSLDVTEKVPLEHVIKAYKEQGYSYLVITDHNRITDATALSREGLVVMAGMEKTERLCFKPLGKHLIVFGPREAVHPPGTLVSSPLTVRAPAHLNWQGNLGTGRWFLQDLLRRQDYQLLEIYNNKSDTLLDVWLWSYLLRQNGWARPIWGIAVDDSDNAKPIDRGWIMIKTEGVTEEAFFASLRRGAFYATTGPRAIFAVREGGIQAIAENEGVFRFINANNEVVAVVRGREGSYEPRGDEVLVRVELADDNGGRAWSQPFYLIPPEDRRPPSRQPS